MHDPVPRADDHGKRATASTPTRSARKPSRSCFPEFTDVTGGPEEVGTTDGVVFLPHHNRRLRRGVAGGLMARDDTSSTCRWSRCSRSSASVEKRRSMQGSTWAGMSSLLFLPASRVPDHVAVPRATIRRWHGWRTAHVACRGVPPPLPRGAARAIPVARP